MYFQQGWDQVTLQDPRIDSRRCFRDKKELGMLNTCRVLGTSTGGDKFDMITSEAKEIGKNPWFVRDNLRTSSSYFGKGGYLVLKPVCERPREPILGCFPRKIVSHRSCNYVEDGVVVRILVPTPDSCNPQDRVKETSGGSLNRKNEALQKGDRQIPSRVNNIPLPGAAKQVAQTSVLNGMLTKVAGQSSF